MRSLVQEYEAKIKKITDEELMLKLRSQLPERLRGAITWIRMNEDEDAPTMLFNDLVKKIDRWATVHREEVDKAVAACLPGGGNGNGVVPAAPFTTARSRAESTSCRAWTRGACRASRLGCCSGGGSRQRRRRRATRSCGGPRFRPQPQASGSPQARSA